jgi:hypothetical protein
MSEVETQENQKTVVAFITGLLIGGLLVWVFSSTPEGKVQQTTNEDTKEQTNEEKEADKSTEVEATNTDTVGTGSVTVADQSAGKVVLLGETKVPTKNGWIVVRDVANGVGGKILGAARYSADEGLMPKSVELIRETVKGSSYQVVFFTNNGDTGFNMTEDTVINGMSTTFKAN